MTAAHIGAFVLGLFVGTMFGVLQQVQARVDGGGDMKRYTFDTDELDFDFYSTDPPVFEIVVQQGEHYVGYFARATFRCGHTDNHLYALVAWGIDEDKALAELFVQLARFVPPGE